MSDSDLKKDLSDAYKICAHLKMDDLTYTHITARPTGADYFYILKFGKMFYQACLQDIIKVSLEGQILDGSEEIYNKTGYVIHSGIYKKRDDVNAIFHLHSLDSIAVSVMKCGLLSISQFAMPFFENISYHNYDSLALESGQHGYKIAQDLDNKNSMLLRSHGTINCGSSLQEAFFYTNFLQKACSLQVKILSCSQEYILPDKKTCKKARDDMLAFEKNLGTRDWNALLKCIKK